MSDREPTAETIENAVVRMGSVESIVCVYINLDSVPQLTTIVDGGFTIHLPRPGNLARLPVRVALSSKVTAGEIEVTYRGTSASARTSLLYWCSACNLARDKTQLQVLEVTHGKYLQVCNPPCDHAFAALEGKTLTVATQEMTDDAFAIRMRSRRPLT